MDKISQKQAVIKATLNVLQERGYSYELGKSKPVSIILTNQDRAKIKDVLIEMFDNKDVEDGKGLKGKKLKSYVSGLMNNWYRKAKEFNQNKIYAAGDPDNKIHNSYRRNMLEILELSNIGSDEYEKVLVSIKDFEEKVHKREVQGQLDTSSQPADDYDVI